VCGLQDEIPKQHDALSSELQSLREERLRIEIELKRLVETIAAGSGSPSIMALIAQREARIRVIINTLRTDFLDLSLVTVGTRFVRRKTRCTQ
jgi:hypothetical protein